VGNHCLKRGALTFPTPQSADRCIAYFVHTASEGITFNGSRGGELVAYSYSDCLSHTLLSTTGYVIRLAGAPISYASKRQQCIALSSTEAEFMAASAAATEVAYLREIFRDLDLGSRPPPLLGCCHRTSCRQHWRRDASQRT
jgi:hypothetical protein